MVSFSQVAFSLSFWPGATPNYVMLVSQAFLDPSRIKAEGGLSEYWTERARKRVLKPSQMVGKVCIVATGQCYGTGKPHHINVTHHQYVCPSLHASRFHSKANTVSLQYPWVPYLNLWIQPTSDENNSQRSSFVHTKHPLASFPKQHRQSLFALCLHCIEYYKLNMVT